MFVRQERSIGEFISFYPVVSIIVILNILIWLLMYIIPNPLGDIIRFVGIGHNISVLHGEYWRLVTPIFLHAQFFSHVAFNSFALILFGPALEQMLGKWKFITAYLAIGIAGNVGTFMIEPTSMIPHLGASGSIYGLFGIYIFMVYLRKNLIDGASANIVQVIFIIGLIMTFLRPGINIAAHIFGFIGGFAVAPIFLKNVRPFSMERNYAKRRARVTDGDGVQFDPQRWQKKRYIPSHIRQRIFWVIIGGLVLLGLIGSYYAR